MIRELGKAVVDNSRQLATKSQDGNEDDDDQVMIPKQNRIMHIKEITDNEEENLDCPNHAISYLKEEINVLPTNVKMDMPQFDGNDPQDLLFKASRYFNCCKTPKDQKLLLASFHLEGKASKWFQWM